MTDYSQGYWTTYTLEEAWDLARANGVPSSALVIQLVPEGNHLFYDYNAVVAAYPQFAQYSPYEAVQHFKSGNLIGVLYDTGLKPLGGTYTPTSPPTYPTSPSPTSPTTTYSAITPSQYVQIDKPFINREYRRGSLIAPLGDTISFRNTHTQANIDIALTAGRGYSAIPQSFRLAPGQLMTVTVSFDAAGLELLANGVNSATLNIVATSDYLEPTTVSTTTPTTTLPPISILPQPTPTPTTVQPVTEEGWEELITPTGELPSVPEEIEWPPPDEPTVLPPPPEPTTTEVVGSGAGGTNIGPQYDESDETAKLDRALDPGEVTDSWWYS